MSCLPKELALSCEKNYGFFLCGENKQKQIVVKKRVRTGQFCHEKMHQNS